MRKWLVNLTGLLTISSSALPLTGCTFNFYVNKVREKVATNLAVQTSGVIKSLIASKQLDADTKSTIDDSLNINGNSIIQNQSENQIIDNWDNFRNAWGFNNNIITKGFSPDSFIVPSGKGSLTSQVNSNRSTNEILGYLTYISALNVIDNNTLYGVLLDNNAIGKPIIKSFLQELKNQAIPEPFGSLIINLVSDYKGNFLTPITTLLTELVDGWNDVTNPNDLKAYMEQWKDPDGQPYSQWIDTSSGSWTLSNEHFENWTENDITLYHGGAYINYLFKKIGIDDGNKDRKLEPDTDPADFKSKYLGEILLQAATGADPLQLLEGYLGLLLTNPKYLFLLITGIIPIVKQVIFQSNDVTKGIKNLTLGDHYPSNGDSYNLKTVFKYLKGLIENQEIVQEGWRDENDHSKGRYSWTGLQKIVNDKILLSPFLYDVKVLVYPLPILLTMTNFIVDGNGIRFDLINTIGTFLNDPSFMNTFKDIYNVIEKLNDQFQGSDGINLDLEALKDFLLNDNSGLLVLLEQVADTIWNIIKPNSYADDEDITDEQLGQLYESIGGQLPAAGGTAPINFRENSLIWVLKNSLADKNSAFNALLGVVIRDDQYQGVANIITEQNEAWIKENYTNYLEPNYPNSKITNIKYKTSENDIEKFTTINYDFYYEVSGVSYHFFIKGIAVDSKDSFLGTHNFKFTDIYLN